MTKKARLALPGKRVLVTGAARGIGAQVARTAAARGASVALVGLEPDRLRALAEELGPRHTWAECDVTDSTALDAAVAHAVDRLGGLDVAVANAGVANMGTVRIDPADALARTVEVNLIGVMRTCSAVLPQIVENRGHLLLVSSAAAFTVLPGMAAYCASKAGVEQFGNALRLEIAHLGATVGTAHPIWIDTDMVRDVKDDLPSFRAALRKLPGPLGSTISVETCARAFVDGVEARSARVYVPRSLAAVAAGRALFSGRVARYLMGREARTAVPRMEAEVRALGRSFGSHSVAAAGVRSSTATAPADAN